MATGGDLGRDGGGAREEGKWGLRKAAVPHLALVDIGAAGGAGVAGVGAVAGEHVDPVLADAVIEAGGHLAVVNVRLGGGGD